ncbi:MAG: carboxypeptidase-like regulatory domain-containing protein [Gemmatimonadota bacterium]
MGTDRVQEGRAGGIVVLVAAFWAVVLAGTPAVASAQRLQGRVLEEETGFPVPNAAVRLLNRDHDTVVSLLADDTGGFVVDLPGVGEYHLQVERLGYRTLQTHLLRIDEEKTYDLDLMVVAEPIALEPIEVTVSSQAVTDVVRQTLGMNPASLSGKVVAGAELEALELPGRELVDVLRWANLPALIEVGAAGVCVRSLRRSINPCGRVYLDGIRVDPEFVEAVDVASLGAVVYVRGIDAGVLFGPGRDQSASGVLLLFTRVFLAGR